MSKTVTMPLNDADKLYAYAERDKQTKKTVMYIAKLRDRLENLKGETKICKDLLEAEQMKLLQTLSNDLQLKINFIDPDISGEPENLSPGT